MQRKQSSNSKSNLEFSIEEETQIQSIIGIVRALVLSCKPPCLLQQILADYKEMEAITLPFRSFGFKSPEEMLNYNNDFMFSVKGDKIFISARANKKSAHIASMIRFQKSSKKPCTTHFKPSNKPIITRFDNYNYRIEDRNNNSETGNHGVRNKSHSTKNLRYLQSSVDQEIQILQQKYNEKTSNSFKQFENREVVTKNQKNKLGMKHFSDWRRQTPKLSAACSSIQKAATPTQSKSRDFPINSKQSALPKESTQSPRKTLNQDKKYSQSHSPNRINSSDMFDRNIVKENNLSIRRPNELKINKEQIQTTSNKSKQQPSKIEDSKNKSKQSTEVVQQSKKTFKESQSVQPRSFQPHEYAQIKCANLDNDIGGLKKLQDPNKIEKIFNKLNSSPSLKSPTNIKLFNSTRPILGQTYINNKSPELETSTSITSKFSVQNRLKINATDISNCSNDSGFSKDSPRYLNKTTEISAAGSDEIRMSTSCNYDNSLPTNNGSKHGDVDLSSLKSVLDSPEQNVMDLLQKHCEALHYDAPVYNALTSKFTGKFSGRVTVGPFCFSSYPKDFSTMREMQLFLANKALNELKEVDESKKQSIPCTDEYLKLVNKIFIQLKNHSCGIFTKNFPEWFENIYKEALPENWESIVTMSNKFIVEYSDTNSLSIIYVNPEADKVINSQINAMKLPWEKSQWEIYITHIASTKLFWGRLVGPGYNDALEDMMNSIYTTMDEEKSHPEFLLIGGIYLAYNVEFQEWNRIRIEENDTKKGRTFCFYIDLGFSDWLAVNDLYTCASTFLQLPAQAIAFELYGLEDFVDHPYAEDTLNEILLRKSYIIQILSKQTEYEQKSNFLFEPRIITAVIYDTDEDNSKILVNDIIKDKIFDKTPLAKVPNKLSMNVLVTHVAENGHLFIQTTEANMIYIKKVLQNVVDNRLKYNIHKVSPLELRKETLYLICDRTMNGTPTWYRANRGSESINESNHIFMFCVDYGYTLSIHLDDIFRLEQLSIALCEFPYQAVEVMLDNIPNVTGHVLARIRALLPPNCTALAKAVELKENSGITSVLMYRHIETVLCTINDVIRIEDEMQKYLIQFK